MSGKRSKKRRNPRKRYNCEYKVIRTRRHAAGGGNAYAYGIFAFSDKGLTEYADNNDFCVIYDISDDPARVDELVRMLRKNRVEPVHIRDVIEDMIS